VLKDKPLQGYWYGTDHDPLDDHRKPLSAIGVPGSPCGTIYDPGDVDPKTINWNAPDTQYIVVRCKDKKANLVWGQMELMPAGLAELKRRREDLLELGVKESPAPAEPDPPSGSKPEHWTRGAWATKKLYACPPSHFRATDSPALFTPQLPTPIQVLSHPGKLYQGKPEGEGATEYVFTWDSLHDDASCAPTSTAATRPAAAISPARATGTVSRPMPSFDNPGSTDIYDQNITVRASDTPSDEPVTTPSGGRFRKIIYPDESKLKHIGGAVEFMVQLGPDGRVHEIETYFHLGPGKADQYMVNAAIEAIKDWRYPRTGLQRDARIDVRFDPN
jgi:hypothetical protein